jgi:hypothetical protein
LMETKSVRTPLVILVAARCTAPGPVHDRRYIDNMIVR